MNRGWDVFASGYGLVIQRDDELAMFESDEDAVNEALHQVQTFGLDYEYARAALRCCALQDYEGWAEYLAVPRS